MGMKKDKYRKKRFGEQRQLEMNPAEERQPETAQEPVTEQWPAAAQQPVTERQQVAPQQPAPAPVQPEPAGVTGEISPLFDGFDKSYDALKRLVSEELSDYRVMLAREKKQADVYRNRVQARDVMEAMLPVLSDIENEVLDGTDLDDVKRAVSILYRRLSTSLKRVGVELKRHDRNQFVENGTEINLTPVSTSNQNLLHKAARTTKMGCVIKGEENNPILEDVEIYSNYVPAENKPAHPAAPAPDAERNQSEKPVAAQTPAPQTVPAANPAAPEPKPVSGDGATHTGVPAAGVDPVLHDNPVQTSKPVSAAGTGGDVKNADKESVPGGYAVDEYPEKPEKAKRQEEKPDAVLVTTKDVQLVEPLVIVKGTGTKIVVLSVNKTFRISDMNDRFNSITISKEQKDGVKCDIYLGPKSISKKTFSLANRDLSYRIHFDENGKLVLEVRDEKSKECLVCGEINYIDGTKN